MFSTSSGMNIEKNIVALIDIFAKYESNAVIQSKTEKEDLKILDAWSDVLAPQLE